MKRKYTNVCQGTTSALTSKATMWKSRQRYVPKLVYSVSVLLNTHYSITPVVRRVSDSDWLPETVAPAGIGNLV